MDVKLPGIFLVSNWYIGIRISSIRCPDNSIPAITATLIFHIILVYSTGAVCIKVAIAFTRDGNIKWRNFISLIHAVRNFACTRTTQSAIRSLIFWATNVFIHEDKSEWFYLLNWNSSKWFPCFTFCYKSKREAWNKANSPCTLKQCKIRGRGICSPNWKCKIKKL